MFGFDPEGKREALIKQNATHMKLKIGAKKIKKEKKKKTTNAFHLRVLLLRATLVAYGSPQASG